MANIMAIRKKELTALTHAMYVTGGFFFSIGFVQVSAMSTRRFFLTQLFFLTCLMIAMTFIFVGLYQRPSLSVLLTSVNLLMTLNFVFFLLPMALQSFAQMNVPYLFYYFPPCCPLCLMSVISHPLAAFKRIWTVRMKTRGHT